MSQLKGIQHKVEQQRGKIDRETLRTQTPQAIPPRAGVSSGGNVIRRAQTQEAAQADEFISVKFVDKNGNEYGDAFDATCIFVDGATQASACLPTINSGSVILISKINDTWYVVYPTLINSTVC